MLAIIKDEVSLSEPGSPAGCQVMSMNRGPPEPMRSNLKENGKKLMESVQRMIEGLVITLY